MADDHSNPPSLFYIRLGPKATVREMAIAAACYRCSGFPKAPQFGITVWDIGRAIVDGLPAFYHAVDGSLTPPMVTLNAYAQSFAEGIRCGRIRFLNGKLHEC